MKKKFFLSLLLFFCLPGHAQEESQFSEEKDTIAQTDAQKEKREAVLPLEDLRVFAESFKRIRSSYVDEITDQDLLILAIKGMLSELDPHSAYLDEEAMAVDTSKLKDEIVQLWQGEVESLQSQLKGRHNVRNVRFR